jgi:hypothetical protein
MWRSWSAQRHGGAAIIYLVGADSTKTQIIFILLKMMSNIPVDNGFPSNTLDVKPTTILNNITIID